MNAKRTSLTIAIACCIGLSALAITAATPDDSDTPPTSPPGAPPRPSPPSTPSTQPPDQQRPDDADRPPPPITQEKLDQATRGWEDKQLQQIRKLTQKYGMPTDAGPNAVAWVNSPPFASIVIYRESAPHRFPVEHTDFLQHTISYKVPAEKASDLLAADGSLRLDRTAGTISARCDTEAHNILSLNLAHDILTGSKNVQQAREAHTQIILAEMAGESHPYLERLQFQPQDAAAARDPDEPGPGADRAPTILPASDRPRQPPR